LCIEAESAAGDAPRGANLAELNAAVRPLDAFCTGSAVVLDQSASAYSSDPTCTWAAWPGFSRVTAYEENRRFICATGVAKGVLHAPERSEGEDREVSLVRRMVFLKPSVYVLDDVVTGVGADTSASWLLKFRQAAGDTGGELRFASGDRSLGWRTLWPTTDAKRLLSKLPNATKFTYHIDAKPEPNATSIRTLQVFDLRGSDDASPVESTFTQQDGQFELTITASGRSFSLTLAPPNVAAGWIEVSDADGATMIARRPLPSGVLPHGLEGMRLIERWDHRYRQQKPAPWDTGVPAEDLKKAVESGAVKPCRTVVLGCGSGTNAIYLASKGFDVTAIDVAPTALHLADAKAQQAGVRVNWVLGDVLAIPEFEPFDFIFDRGCYHNVRYADAAGFVKSVCRLTHPGTKFLLLSLNRDGPPGVREHHMRDDFGALFEFEWLRDSQIRTGDDAGDRRGSWSVMLRRKADS
jgi:SAM-dependent methyltransferase